MVDEATYNAADLVQGAPRSLECAKRGQPHEMWMDGHDTAPNTRCAL